MTGTESLPERPLSLLLVFVVLLSVAWPILLWSVIIVLDKCTSPHSRSVCGISVASPHTKVFLPKMSEALGALEALQTSQHGRIGKLFTRLPPWPPHSSGVTFSGFDTGP